jgi:hypothetical protein
VLANLRFADGVAAFGLIMSAFGGGALLGILLAGVLPTPSPRWLGTTLLSVISLMGIGLVVIGLARVSAVAALAALAMGIANGYNNILLTTWLQGRMSPAMLGRSMSLLMFAAIGLTPLSTALAGLLISVNASALLVGAGGAMAICTLYAALSPAIRSLGMEPDAANETAMVIA